MERYHDNCCLGCANELSDEAVDYRRKFHQIFNEIKRLDDIVKDLSNINEKHLITAKSFNDVLHEINKTLINHAQNGQSLTQLLKDLGQAVLLNSRSIKNIEERLTILEDK